MKLKNCITITLSLLILGCADAPPRYEGQMPESEGERASGEDRAVVDSLTIIFTRDEAPFAVERPGHPGLETEDRLREAMEWLVRGPTEEEREEGVWSWFSEETRGVLHSVELDSAGRATIDFVDLRPLIPNASTSHGSQMLLQELNGTAFQFPEVRSIEYRMEGSCDLFGEWLQYGCQIVTAPE